MSRVHFVGGEKGGVGKSMTSRLLAQYIIDSEKSFIGFDTDQSHGTFSRFYADFASPLIVDNYDSMDQMILVAEKNPNLDLIVDLAAQTSTKLGKWIDESDAVALLEELGRQVYLWHVMDDGADSMSLLENLLNRYQQPSIKFVIVNNLGRGDNFDHFEQSDLYRKTQERGAIFIKLAKLQSQLMQRIDFSNTSFWAAANNPEVMNIIERSRVRVWLRDTYAQFDKLKS